MLLFGHEPAIQTGRRAAAAGGFRVLGEATSPGKAVTAARAVPADGILVIADSAASSGEILSSLEGAKLDPAMPVVVVSPGADHDLGRNHSNDIIRTIIANDPASLLLVLRDLAVPRAVRFHDAKNHGGPRLQQLSEEVGRIANILASLSEDDGPEDLERDEGMRIDAALVRSVIRVRRLRDHFFRSAMFADPAWDMLLDLYAARLERQRVAVSSLCIAAAVPATTALRWIKTMTDQRLFVRVADPQDGRRVFIELSDEAAAGLEAYLKAAQRICPLIV
ncbi:hypothetical protein C7I55_02280 [Sphingomonas deserti]|uniref:Uncharacterized protein n=1 Tax=Allosphingosinicella deserti TaxID=2116704 RepID=A0A2P7QZ52_9SPHN|nr:hypothetical protein C7I55_02280 [Sphingomonas deserti]